jgi:transposase InsO family protein
MPWKESSIVIERTKFVLEWKRRWDEAEGGRVDVAELCRVFGISRTTGYVWINRFIDSGFDVREMVDRSSRPHHSPTAVSQEMEDFIVAMRKQNPRWGPRMMRERLVAKYPGREFPSASTFGNIFKRNGLAAMRRRRQRARVPALAEPLGVPTAPNSIWCIDYKGDFRTGDGARCYPLTVLDAFTRLCIRCESTSEISGRRTEHVLDSAFREFGLPATIRSDNGSPFAAPGPLGLSALAVWLLRLGIRLERITPGKPQQNGKQERFHRTLKDFTASPPAASLRAQQRVFDLFRRDYNEERPHQALGMKPPASKYAPSAKKYPRGLIEPPSQGHTCEVERDGSIRWIRRRIFISTALACQRLSVAPDDGGRWLVFFGEIELGHFYDDARSARPFIARPRPRAAHYLQLQGTS